MRPVCCGFFKNVKPVSSLMLGLLFATLCLVILGGGVLAIESFKEIKMADYIQIIIMIFIAGTMFVGLYTHRHEKKYAQSATNLESALSLIDRAAQVLKVNGVLTNDRVAWVTSARLIARAEELREAITTDTHQLIFDAEHDFRRHSFRELLRPDGKDLSGAFFCGGDSSMTIGEVVTDSSHPENGSAWIPTRIVSVIYRFITFPEGYQDPLSFSEAATDKVRSRFQLLGYEGVSDYLGFRKNFRAVGSKVRHNNNNNNNGENCLAGFIDSVVISSKYDFDE